MSASEEFRDRVELEFEQIVGWLTEVQDRTREAFKEEDKILFSEIVASFMTFLKVN